MTGEQPEPDDAPRRRIPSRLAPVMSYAVPFVPAAVVAYLFASRLPAPPTFVSGLLRWVAVVVAATIVYVATDRLAARVVAGTGPSSERSGSAKGTVAVLGAVAGAIGIAMSSTSVIAFDPLSFTPPAPFVGGDPFTEDEDEAARDGDSAAAGGVESDSGSASKSLRLPKVSLGGLLAAAGAQQSSTDPTGPEAVEVEPTPESTTTTNPPADTTEPPSADTTPDPTTTRPTPTTTTIRPETTATTKPSTTTTTKPSTTTTKPATTTTKPSTTTTTKPSTTTTTKPSTTTTTSTSTTTTSTSTSTSTTTSTTTTTVPGGSELSGPLFLGGGAAGDTSSAAVLPLVGGAPPALELPNYDIERNDDVGLTLQPTGLGSWAETDPAKVQRFATTVPEFAWIKGPAAVTVHLAAEGFVTAEMLVEASIYHCRPGAGCEKIKKRTVWFAAGEHFTPVTFEYDWLNGQFHEGDQLEVRIAAWQESEVNLLVAFGTADYPSSFEFDVYETD